MTHEVSFWQSIIALLTGILLIILLTVRYRMHAFFALLAACLWVGTIIQLPLTESLRVAKEGFGHIIGSLALIIVLGTTLGVLLEYTRSTTVIANFILSKVGADRSALAMNISGYIVGMPIFCDSGFIVLNGLNKELAARSGTSLLIMASSLATGLYAVHCLMPPHPGMAAATETLEADFGAVILYGLLVAVPASYCGYLWSKYAGRKIALHKNNLSSTDERSMPHHPSLVAAIMPILVPIALIALRSFFMGSFVVGSIAEQVLLTIGMPEVALIIGIILVFMGNHRMAGQTVTKLLHDGVEKAAGILVIIGAGGAFGAILAEADLGRHFAENIPIASLGLFFPFLIATVLKTAQGSSTVAVITAASIVTPLLTGLGLESESGRVICVLALGAGSMMISHANDAYFWVIAKFSGLPMQAMLKVYSVATCFMGVVAIICIYLLAIVLL
ncbi:GntP family permease [Olivibacter sp. SDN3]|uniref:GntP family permease n=1 Tax=Olivibacter sp. SDN3 TaxID=2764720 RepID=UPI00165163D3|nr:GntP family permease [Olivibacter sp. SDN3]QNL49853.1 GntP family permease [Olivibacter sp. SDN3]